MTTVTPETFYASLREAMAEKVRKALEAEIEPACDRLRAKLREQVGQIVLSMMEHSEREPHEPLDPPSSRKSRKSSAAQS